MTITTVPPVDEQILAILMRNGLFAATPAAARTTEEILRVIEEEQLRTCTDNECVTRRAHSRLGPHLWRHEACAPFSHPFPGLWMCFACGHRRGHRIHRIGAP